MQKNIKSIKHSIVFENGIAEESMQEFEDGVKIRIYGEDKAILLSQNYNLPFHSAPVKVYFEKYIQEYNLTKLQDDFISVHVNNNFHHYYFTIKKSNKVSTQFTYRMDDSKIYRSKTIPVKYEDIDAILDICSSIG